MTEILIAAFSAVVAAGAVAVSFAAHRHQVQRAAVLDAKEARVESRERQVEEREAEAERRETRSQASMIAVRALMVPSSLHGNWHRVELDITNHSNQAVFHLNVSYQDQEVEEGARGISPGCTRTVPLEFFEPSGRPTVLDKVRIEFTDAAGIRWHRDADGGLRRQQRGDDGGWEWGERETPIIFPTPATRLPERRPDGYSDVGGAFDVDEEDWVNASPMDTGGPEEEGMTSEARGGLRLVDEPDDPADARRDWT
ncbi:hypothetical protein AR457_32675 [Streptomyces agglomeratus]|uniref:Uncharacterized protein n=1 Tax=Streptomyces agglomeratus TaxID=285458 RepID=A0A1E5PG84_9ACTN|nr:hypothetical protein [Streptomyces agglomeratus]OEJ28516.1 hypothetical protein AS594_32585 [Streptomyces agglomeratus]OEJ37420.1 hypothetical protein BGK70_03985 [Streptomyces agglomeratus]OEJ48195.1 hypothetical protein AR457_32675 [Streptomyces agglomeratus]OEJ49961.1 hypothetical protein BGK72_03480 [Streptomyces agglomeratus]OEJ57288.1 hypothetical protein BGM19_04165 [Streptomyces agglomeratus]